MTIEDGDERPGEVSRLQQRAHALEVEVERRKQIESELRASQEELKNFVENALEGLHWVGPDGIIQWVNRAELELLGYTREEYVGHHISEFHADQVNISGILARLGRNEVLRNHEARLKCRDGSIKDVLIDSNVAWKDGKFLHTCCFTRDITQRKRTETVPSRHASTSGGPRRQARQLQRLVRQRQRRYTVRMMEFTAVYKKVAEGYVAYVEELPGANTQGDTLDEARENLKEAVELVLESNRALAREDAGNDDLIREPLRLATG